MLPPELGIDARFEAHLRAAGGSVLDAGCGNGNKIPHLVSAFGPDVSGVDLTNCILPEVRALGKVIHTNTPIERMPFADGTFSLVYCYWVLDRRDFYNCVREMRRVLRPGGLLFIFYSGLWEQYALITKSANNVLLFKCEQIVVGYLRDRGYFYPHATDVSATTCPYYPYSYNNEYEVGESLARCRLEVVERTKNAVLVRRGPGDVEPVIDIYDAEAFRARRTSHAAEVKGAYDAFKSGSSDVRGLTMGAGDDEALVSACMTMLLLSRRI